LQTTNDKGPCTQKKQLAVIHDEQQLVRTGLVVKNIKILPPYPLDHPFHVAV
jgi:hypothetical protein